MKPRAALAFQGVSKRYRKKGPLALDDVSWSIQRGARACLLGPNGAGKSTAIRLLQGALQPTTGRVHLLDREVNGPDYLQARRRTGIVPQSPGMYQDLTAWEYLELARRLYACHERDVQRVTEAFGLGEHRDKMLTQLSGGYQRRLALAAALLSEPEVLLLDEPTVGLDPVAAHDVAAYLRQAMRGRTTLLCTHNLAEAETLCDEVVILRDGRVLVHESLADLRKQSTPRLRLAARQGTSALLAAVRARGLTADPDPNGSDDGAILVGVTTIEIDAPALLRALLNDGLDVFECRPVQPTLQSVFLDLVRA